MQCAYGLGIQSDHQFSGLPEEEFAGAGVAFRVSRVAALPDLALVSVVASRAQGLNVYVKLRAEDLFLRVAGFLEFRVSQPRRTIDCLALAHVPDNILMYWVVQQVIPLYLLFAGTAEFFHGMSIALPSEEHEAEAGCLAFLGDSYAGKSTLLTYFLSRGSSLVCDDHLALSRGDYATILPAAPYYRPYRASQDLGYKADRFTWKPTPLHRIYLLEPTLAYEEIEAKELRGLSAIQALLPLLLYNLHNRELPELFPLVAERFRGLNLLVQRTSIKRLSVPRALDRLPEVYDFIQQDLVS